MPKGLQLNHPTGVAIDSSGNVWVEDYLNNRVLKFSPAGTLLAAHGSYGSEEGELIDPRDIAINQTTGNVYVTDEGNNRIVELNSSGAFLDTFGWGVKDGKEEFEVCNSGSDCRAGIAGSGPGQFKTVKGVAVAGGDVWVTDYGNDRIEEFNEKGEYLKKFGTEGTGEVQFKEPVGIAFDGGNLYVAEAGNNRVQGCPPRANTCRSGAKPGPAMKANSKNRGASPWNRERGICMSLMAATIACRSSARRAN